MSKPWSLNLIDVDKHPHSLSVKQNLREIEKMMIQKNHKSFSSILVTETKITAKQH